MEDHDGLVSSVASRIRRYGMQAPAVLVLEMFRPLAFFGSQLLYLAQPLFGWGGNDWLSGGGAALLEDPENLNSLIERIMEPEQRRGNERT
jgi:hypothetical protein